MDPPPQVAPVMATMGFVNNVKQIKSIVFPIGSFSAAYKHLLRQAEETLSNLESEDEISLTKRPRKTKDAFNVSRRGSQMKILHTDYTTEKYKEYDFTHIQSLQEIRVQLSTTSKPCSISLIPTTVGGPSHS
ncbi:hypothetical protein AVEN_115438-1 [Araneus ventricosus]|uniref:Uncharacterized protein n=1 Tax=Araneus ventricosus TaxID=182803 RepID=A0A4Y2WX70_ARAVE|nr:hypothetical protein AVEN_115438-1 [Araneus ventricosus]